MFRKYLLAEGLFIEARDANILKGYLRSFKRENVNE